MISILLYYKRKSEIESYYFVFRCILRMLYQSKKLSNLNITLFKEEREVIRKCALQLKGFQRNSGIVLNPKGGNILDIILDYVRMLTHIDLMKFNNMLSIVMKKEKEILLIYEKIGYMDALISIVSFRKFKEKDGFCEPEFIEQPGYLSFEKGYHPFLNDPVFNDFKSDGSTLIIF